MTSSASPVASGKPVYYPGFQELRDCATPSAVLYHTHMLFRKDNYFGVDMFWGFSEFGVRGVDLFFVAYGSGHVKMIMPLAQALTASGLAEPVVLALTTAALVARAAGLAVIQFKDFVTSGDGAALQLGAQFVDIHCLPKAKLVPGKHKEMIFGAGAGFAGFAIAGMGMGPHGQEFMAVGDRQDIRPVLWMPSTAVVTCDGHVNGQPHALDSRVIAKKALAAFREATGLEFFSGLEPEFFLLRKDPAGQYVVATGSEALDKPCYDFRHLSTISPFLMELQTTLAEAGIDVYQIDPEDANGQFEMNFTYADGLKTADNLTYFNMAAQAIAKKHGMLCSFMPKPFAERSGSGLHMHMSAGKKFGDNALEDAGDPRGMSLSPLAYQFVAGLMANAHAFTAIAAPSVKSYKRLVKMGSSSGATWAPVNIAWGNNNRTAFVRIPGGRLELRLPDAASNPYLLTAAIIYAGLDGIQRQLKPGEPCNENLYALSSAELAARGIARLPASLPDALDALAQSDVLTRGLGEAFVREFIEVKHAECDSLMLHVSQAEFNRYVDFF